MSESWTTIESDPGVFTELMTSMGVVDVQMEELYDLDAESLVALKPVYGLIFLFKYQGNGGDVAAEPCEAPGVFFANQVINNACATQAILSVLLNRPEIELGAELQNFKDFTADFPPDMRGEAIGNSEAIRRIHNSFAAPESIVSEESPEAKDSDDLFHFISYVPVCGVVYELDGLRRGPVRLGEAPGDDWLAVARSRIQERIEKYSQGEIRFNLMALIGDRRKGAAEKLATYAASRQLLEETAGSSPTEMQQLQMLQIDEEIRRLNEEIQREQDKFSTWRDENIRRKHNYVPFMFNFLQLLAEKGQLKPFIEKARAPVPPKP